MSENTPILNRCTFNVCVIVINTQLPNIQPVEFERNQEEETEKILIRYRRIMNAMKGERTKHIFSVSLQKLEDHLKHPLLIRDTNSESEYKNALKTRLISNETKLLKRKLNCMIYYYIQNINNFKLKK